MYKSRLQELCQDKEWRLPSYSTVKDGPDHNPHFTASVTVNDRSFPTTSIWKSSKEAQNEAARIAFDHLSVPPPSPSRPRQVIFTPHQRFGDASSSLSGSSSLTNKMKDKARNELNSVPTVEGSKLPKNQEISRSPLFHENTSAVKDDFEGIQHLYKNQLQSYAQRHNISLPTYSFVREGLAHALRFKATVTIGQTFESPGFFRTLREAEHAAAKVALMSLSSDGTETEESVVYKNLLQELTQKEGFSLPVYTTTTSGASHMPIFSSTVEVEGEVFYGQAAKTKKQAEMNAAKLAYSDLKERRSSRMTVYPHPNGHELEATVFTSSSSNPVDGGRLQQNLKPINMTVSTSVTASEDHGDKGRDGDREVDSTNAVSARSKISTHDFIPSPKPSNMTMRNKESSLSDSIYSSLRDPFPSVPSADDETSSSSTASDCSGNLAVDSDIKVPTAKETSSLLCNRVRIYPRMPNVVFPKGVTILPISDDKWVAVSLEFQDLAVQ